jgi:hypothetical protein
MYFLKFHVLQNYLNVFIFIYTFKKLTIRILQYSMLCLHDSKIRRTQLEQEALPGNTYSGKAPGRVQRVLTIRWIM